MRYMPDRKKQQVHFLLFHIGALLTALAFFLYVKGSRAGLFGPVSCVFHDLFHVYCPSCGGTRAILELLRFHPVRSFLALPVVPLGAVAGLVLYVRAWVAFVRREKKLLWLPGWLIWSFLGLYLLYGLVRAVLLVGFRIDLLGDFYPR